MTSPARRAAALCFAGYGLLVVVANARNDVFASDYTREWVLFGGRNDLPGDFGRNVFAGSVGLGALICVVAGLVCFLGGRRATRRAGIAVTLFSVVLLVGYRESGNLLAARPAAAAVLAAAGSILVASSLTPGPKLEGGYR